jgi:hypothetical protein
MASNPAWTTTSAKRSEPKASPLTTPLCGLLWIWCAGNESHSQGAHSHNRLMTWEWIGTSVVGVAGIWGTWFTGKQSRDQALATLRQQLGHDRLQAREAREQERLESAYLELLKMVHRAGQWAEMVYPVFQSGPPPDIRLPSLDIQADAAALVAAFGTPEVEEKLEAWRSVLRQMITQAGLVPRQDERPADVPPGELIARAKIHELRPEEKKRRDALAAQVRSELAFGYRSTRPAVGVTRTYTQNPPSPPSV